MSLPAGWESAALVEPTDPILDDVRPAYPGFDAWFARVRAEGRPARIVRAPDGTINALLVAKIEPDALKISTLAVAPNHREQGLGRALLEDALALAATLRLPRLYATAYTDPATLAVFAAAGFGADSVLANNELVLARPFDRWAAVHTFHVFHGLYAGTTPDLRAIDLRQRLVLEEIDETIEAIEEDDLAHAAVELADIIYVAYGSLVTWGVQVPDPVTKPSFREPRLRAPQTWIARLRAARSDIAASLPVDDLALATAAIVRLVATVDAAAFAFGLPLDRFFAEIHRANLAKDPAHRPYGKLSKPAGWRAPDAEARLADVRTAYDASPRSLSGQPTASR